MALSPELILYKNEEQPIKIVQPFIPMKTFKKLGNFQNKLEGVKDDDIDGMFDVLSEFIVDLFQNKVSKEDLEEYADFNDLMKIFFSLGEISKSYSPKPTKTQKKK